VAATVVARRRFVDRMSSFQLQSGSLEFVATQPQLVLACPCGTAVVDDPLPQKHFRHPVPYSHQVPEAVLTGPHHIPGSFLLGAGNRHFPDLTQMLQAGQVPGVAGIGLDSIPRRALQF
jgi:hypothetical protein